MEKVFGVSQCAIDQQISIKTRSQSCEAMFHCRSINKLSNSTSVLGWVEHFFHSSTLEGFFLGGVLERYVYSFRRGSLDIWTNVLKTWRTSAVHGIIGQGFGKTPYRFAEYLKGFRLNDVLRFGRRLQV